MYEALLEGNNRNSFQYLKNEYNEQTDHPATNLSLMVLGHQFINKPEVVDSIYQHIPMDDIDLDKCQQCVNRLYVKGLADLELGKSDEVVKLIAPFAKTKGQHWLKQTLIRAYVLEGNQEGVKNVLDSYKLLADNYKRWGDLNIWAAKEYLLQDDKTTANLLFEQFKQELNKDQLSEDDYAELLAYVSFYQEDFQEAEKHFERLVKKDPERTDYNTFLAISYSKNGKDLKAKQILEQLESLRKPYQYGAIDYALAQYYGATGNEQKTLDHLLKAVAAGRRFLPGNYHHDILLKPYWDRPVFQNVLNFWK